MRSKLRLILIILILACVGPYVFVYARTATWTLPRIDERDFAAIENVEPYIGSVANLTDVENVSGAQEATYSVDTGILHRKFLDWIGFPLVLEVNNFEFKASGIYQDKIIFTCNHLEPSLPKPTGTEPWNIYQLLVDEYNDSFMTVSCIGDTSIIDPKLLPTSITLDWSISTTLVGDRNEEVRPWNGTETMEIRDGIV
jgi:hypothetical protein